MLTAIALALFTGVGTALGGVLAFRTKDRLHLVLGLSAGLLLGLVAFDLLPEIFQSNTSKIGGIRTISLALVLGFLLLHFVERFFGSHEPTDSEYQHGHTHQSSLGGLFGALAMGGHVFLDGVALGVSIHLGVAFAMPVIIALFSHAFSDGVNTVSFLVRAKKWNKYSVFLILFDALARVRVWARREVARCCQPSVARMAGIPRRLVRHGRLVSRSSSQSLADGRSAAWRLTTTRQKARLGAGA